VNAGNVGARGKEDIGVASLHAGSQTHVSPELDGVLQQPQREAEPPKDEYGSRPSTLLLALVTARRRPTRR
jgi:hypothetical protein